MAKDLENKSFNDGLAADDKTKTDSYMYENGEEAYSDENTDDYTDDYNENIYMAKPGSFDNLVFFTALSIVPDFF